MTMTPPATLTRLLLLVAAAGLLAGVGVAVTGAHAQQQQQQDSPFCRQVAALVEQEPCVEPVPRDVVFLVDKSYSMNATQLNEDVLSYTQQLFCSLDAAAGSRATSAASSRATSAAAAVAADMEMGRSGRESGGDMGVGRGCVGGRARLGV